MIRAPRERARRLPARSHTRRTASRSDRSDPPTRLSIDVETTSTRRLSLASHDGALTPRHHARLTLLQPPRKRRARDSDDDEDAPPPKSQKAKKATKKRKSAARGSDGSDVEGAGGKRKPKPKTAKLTEEVRLGCSRPR